MKNSDAVLILKLLDLLALGLTAAPLVLESYRAARDKIDVMVKEGRDPTPEEMAELDHAIAHLSGQLHG